MYKIKNALDEVNRTLDLAEEISDHEDITTETIQNEKLREK